MFKKHGKVPVFFERNYKTQHLQIQVIPVIKEDATLVTKQFLEQGWILKYYLLIIMSISIFFTQLKRYTIYTMRNDIPIKSLLLLIKNRYSNQLH